jgi:hypothetical protein
VKDDAVAVSQGSGGAAAGATAFIGVFNNVTALAGSGS